VAEDPDARGAELKLRVEYPCACPIDWLLVPSHWSDQVEAAVPVHVAMADAMARPLGGQPSRRPFDRRRS
jgi:hypothetical protein